MRVRGTVTVRDEARNLTFIQDATGGLFVTATPSSMALSRGQAVDVRGTAVMTRRGPTITGAVVTQSGAPFVINPQPLSVAEGRLMAMDGRLVATSGVVRAVQTLATGVELTIKTIEGVVTVLEPAGTTAGTPPVDALVNVQGVLSHLMTEERALQRRELVAASPSRVLSAPPADPYAVPETRVDDLRRQPPGTELVRRVRVTGIVTRQRPGQSLHIRTATAPIRAGSDLATLVSPGDRVEVAGFPETDGFTPFLANAIFRRVDSGPPPEPVPATLGELIDGSRDAELVRVEGTFLEGDRGSDEYTLVVQDGDLVFNAQLLLSSLGDLESRLSRGERVQLTGICSVIVDSDSVPRAFRLQLRDANDIRILAASPLLPMASRIPSWAWMTILLGVIGAGAAGLVYRRDREKEHTIRRQLAREAALKARFDDLFERSSEIMIVHDRRGRVSTINRAGEQATGYSREEIRMLDPNWVFGSDYLDSISRMIGEGSDTSPQSFRSELVPRKGARVPIEVHAKVLIGDGQMVGVTAIARDLSERDRLENELRQAQKMEAVGRLATGIAHDFNNLITVLLGYSDELIEQVPPGSEWQRSATEIRRAAERASGLTQQLLAFSRRQTTISHTVDLNHTVAHMEDLLRRLVGPEIRLEFSLDPGLANIRADGAQLGQVLMNLVVECSRRHAQGRHVDH